MKKFSFLVLFLLGSTIMMAQDLAEINEMLGKSEYKKAKEAIDKFLTDSKNAAKSDGWYFKGRIYNAYSKDAALSIDDAMKLKSDAFEAYKKNQQLDAKDIRLIFENYVSYFDLYNGYFDLGVKGFNTQNFDGAFAAFKNALLVEDYVKSKGYENGSFKFPVLDTSLVLNTAKAARLAKKESEALPYYKMLADANLTSDGYLEVYEYLTEYYLKQNEMSAFSEMLEKGKKLFPQNAYWEAVDVEQAIAGLKKEELFKKYDELLLKYPNSYVVTYNYTVELYRYIYSDDAKTLNTNPQKLKLVEVSKKAIAIKSTAEANFLLANFLYNDSYDLSDAARQIKGTKPEDLKKKKELSDASKKELDESIPYAETGVDLYSKMTKLKGSEKVNYRQLLDLLSEGYRVKGNPTKSAEFKAKKDALQ